MKVSKQVLTLMVVLAAGSASAAAGTTAGQTINNTATADFTDPATGNPATPVVSNKVTTSVNAITGFDIVYTSGTDDTSPTGPLPGGYDQTNVLPGAAVTTTYTVVNNSNIDGYKIDFTPTIVNPAGKVPVVKYYPAGTTSFIPANEITSRTLAKDAQVGIIQVITIPANALPGEVYSASPNGTAAAVTTAPAPTPAQTAAGIVPPTYGAYAESTNQNTAGTPPTNGDLEYTRATIFTPALTETPTVTTITPTPPIAPTAGPPVTPGTPGTPNNPVSPPGTNPGAGDPSQPGYSDPTTPNATTPATAIVVDVAGNNQTAFPLTGVTTVTFNNQVNNAGTLPDTVKLFPADPITGLPIGTLNPDGSFTVNGTIVKFLSSTGTALPLVGGYPTVTAPANGTVNYRTEVSNFPIAPANPEGTVITVGISSGNKGGAVSADAKTTDTILPPGLQFGDASGTNPDGSLVGPGNAAQVVDPSKPVSTAPVTDAGVNTDRTAVFPMIIKNTGEYNDTYLLQSDTIIFKNADGTTTPVKVRYVDSTGALLPTNTAGDYFTPVVATDAQLTVYAVVDVPATAAATNGTTTGTNPNYQFVQKATANYSGAVIIDSANDQIQVGVIGGITVAKTQSVKGGAFSTADASALPGDTLSYKIVATNTYNTSVFNFKLKDSNATGGNAFTYTTFVSASVALAGFTGQTPALTSNVFYSVDGGATFSTTAPTPITVGVNGIQVAVDTDNSNTITAADQVPAGASITLTINTTVK